MTGTAVFIYSPELECYHYPDFSPFNTRRAGRTRELLASEHLLSGSACREVGMDPASHEEMGWFHTTTYLDAMEAAERGHVGMDALDMGLGSMDCPVFEGVFAYAGLACGASMTGARLLLDGKAHIAFNPSGGFHHAGPAHAAGFCYINDVVLACLLLTKAGKRVMVIDVDVHHGDGVQNAFYDRDDVMMLSFHESGRTLFPGTGAEDEIGIGAGLGCSVNVPFPVGTHDEAYLRAFREIALPLLDAYAPDVIVMELGLDGLAGDPLAHLNLTNNAYADMVQRVIAAERPILAVGGGGYHLENTVRGWALLWQVMCGMDTYGASAVGLGGVMLANTEWHGGYRDRTFVPDIALRREVDRQVDETIAAVQQNVFPFHGLFV